MAIAQAYSKPSEIFKGFKPISKRYKAYSKRAPAKTTIPVVPSPISLS